MHVESGEVERRTALCRVLGFPSLADAHQFIAASAATGGERLAGRGLNAQSLQDLGYDCAGMKRLGYGEQVLLRLGYYGPVTQTPPPAQTPARPLRAEPTPPRLPEVRSIRELIAAGCRALKLKEMGYTVHHCKKAELGPSELHQVGYELSELAAAFSCAELRHAGFRANELTNYFNAQSLKNAGFSAMDMRVAGFTIRELRKFGFSDNHIVSAGYSINELQREGLSKRVTDRRQKQMN